MVRTIRQIAQENGYEVARFHHGQKNEYELRKQTISFWVIGSPSEGYNLYAEREFILPEGLPVTLYKYTYKNLPYTEYRLASTERLNCWAVINEEQLEQILKLN